MISTDAGFLQEFSQECMEIEYVYLVCFVG